GKAVGTDGPQEDSAESEANILINDLSRVSEAFLRGGHEGGHAIVTENLASPFDIRYHSFVAVTSRPWTIGVVQRGRAVYGRGKVHIVLGAKSEHVVGEL